MTHQNRGKTEIGRCGSRLHDEVFATFDPDRFVEVGYCETRERFKTSRVIDGVTYCELAMVKVGPRDYCSKHEGERA